MSLVEPELPTLPEHMRSSPIFSGVRVAPSLVFCVMFCRLLFVLVLTATVLAVFRRFATSDYLPFDISKLFLCNGKVTKQLNLFSDNVQNYLFS